eukprot:339484-Rhodomonas_salina.1
MVGDVLKHVLVGVTAVLAAAFAIGGHPRAGETIFVGGTVAVSLLLLVAGVLSLVEETSLEALFYIAQSVIVAALAVSIRWVRIPLYRAAFFVGFSLLLLTFLDRQILRPIPLVFLDNPPLPSLCFMAVGLAFYAVLWWRSRQVTPSCSARVSARWRRVLTSAMSLPGLCAHRPGQQEPPRPLGYADEQPGTPAERLAACGGNRASECARTSRGPLRAAVEPGAASAGPQRTLRAQAAIGVGGGGDGGR